MATGNTTRIEKALLSRAASLVLSPVRRIAWPGTAFTPITNEIYLSPGILWNTSERGELGPNAARRHRGIFQVNVRGPAVGNPETDAEVADAIIEWFDKQVIVNSGVTVRIGNFDGGNSVPSRGGAIPDAATGWRLIPVSIPFWCDIFPS